jgi:uncharacterized damage-inducible protein DinB
MLDAILCAIMVRDLRALHREIALYPSDESLWRVPPGISNSGGTLALHLAGNIQHFVGAQLGETGYVRDRDSEFAVRDLSREELLHKIEQTVTVVQETFERLDSRRLAEEYPQEVGGVNMRTDDFLVHLASHLGYHLGQVDYHRRLVTGVSATAGTMRLPELATAERLGPARERG